MTTSDINSQITHLKKIYRDIFTTENIYSLETVSDFGPPQGGKRCKGMVSGGMGVYGIAKRVDEIGKLRGDMSKDEIREVYLCSVVDTFAFGLYGQARSYGLDHHQSMLVLYLYPEWMQEEKTAEKGAL